MFRLINTSELYTSNGQGNASGTLPKMTFAPMKEELSRLVSFTSNKKSLTQKMFQNTSN